MNVTLGALHESATCTWCARSKECIIATFDNGFIQSEPLCWSCLKNAVKVQSRKNSPGKSKDRPPSDA